MELSFEKRVFPSGKGSTGSIQSCLAAIAKPQTSSTCEPLLVSPSGELWSWVGLRLYVLVPAIAGGLSQNPTSKNNWRAKVSAGLVPLSSLPGFLNLSS